METILIHGKNLTPQQIDLLPFLGKSNKKWIESHAFYFSKDGTQYTTNVKEYYPIVKSLSFLPY